MIASIVIPTYQYAKLLREAIESALAQTVPCEVIVVDDGSTDETPGVVASFGDRIRSIVLAHGGPSLARNAGIDAAGGEFVMFLDADDLIEPNKIEAQLAAFSDEIGWVLCDVRIDDAATGRSQTASERYDYAARELGGWIQPILTERNIIPIMSPLVRRSVLSNIRFDDSKIPEDWHFWHSVSGAARVRYLPHVLATYRKSRTGRSRMPAQARKVTRNITQPLRLNLGCGTEGTRSWHPVPGMVNLDKSMGWRFEDGLGDFVAGSVAGITVSHALMYVRLTDWPAVFSEFARVLADGGIIRITEDNTADVSSRTFRRGWHDAVTLTNPGMVKAHLAAAGLKAYDALPTESKFSDRSLIQQQHGDPPHVFFVEGARNSAVLFSPHCDDESLFAAFTILRYRPRIIVCFPSSGSYGSDEVRAKETRDAMSVLGGDPVEFWDGAELEAHMHHVDARLRPTKVFAPHPNASHRDHIDAALAAERVFGGRLVRYHTYNSAGKVREGREVIFEPRWVQSKLRALARYESQIVHPRAHSFFLEDLREYLADDVA